MSIFCLNNWMSVCSSSPLFWNTNHVRDFVFSMNSIVELCLYCFYPSFQFSGRVRYKFASFWNRNHALRALQRGAKNYHAMLEAEKKVYSFLLNHFFYDVLLLFTFVGVFVDYLVSTIPNEMGTILNFFLIPIINLLVIL